MNKEKSDRARIGAGTTKGKDREKRHEFQYPQGMLSFLGYHVGKSGLKAKERKRILLAAYNDQLPLIQSRDYLDKWGSPGTSARLAQIAYSIFFSIKNAKKWRGDRFNIAIAHWTSDLDWLKSELYVTRHYNSFRWPKS
jgi:hypothetical protein